MINAKVILDSINTANNKRLITLEVEYPRFIIAEVNTHRMLSKNSASSRAIPIDSIIDSVRNNPAMPVHWGANQSGMQAAQEVQDISAAMQAWLNARDRAIQSAIELKEQGLHKQIVNRVLEPFLYVKTVISGTEWNNWRALRKHPDAQPEIHALAIAIDDAMNNSVPKYLKPGEWHAPYVKEVTLANGQSAFVDENDVIISLDEALAISVSCCAQVSYRKNDPSLEKASKIFDRLINSKPVHASPTEHQAIALPYEADFRSKYVTHKTSNWEIAWSGNFQGWGQYRQVIKGNVVKG